MPEANDSIADKLPDNQLPKFPQKIDYSGNFSETFEHKKTNLKLKQNCNSLCLQLLQLQEKEIKKGEI